MLLYALLSLISISILIHDLMQAHPADRYNEWDAAWPAMNANSARREKPWLSGQTNLGIRSGKKKWTLSLDQPKDFWKMDDEHFGTAGRGAS